MKENQSFNGMPLPLLMDMARKETITQVHNIMARYQMPAFLYATILSDVVHMVSEASVKEKEEAEQYWQRKQNDIDRTNTDGSKEENTAKADDKSAT